MMVSRRAFLASLLTTTALPLVEMMQPRAAGRYDIGAMEVPTATLTLVNDDPTNASVVGTPTRMFGWPFPPGAIKPYLGQFPKFTVSGVEQLYSMSPANACRFWPDGSLAFAVFALLPNNFTVAANGGTQAVQIGVKTGASYPAATRTTADIYNQSLGIWAPMASTDAYDAGTNWASVLSSGNTNNIRKTRKWLQGAAGDCWCFTVDMAGGVSGTYTTPASTANAAPHGLLATEIYAWALTDGSGNLGGMRFWADVRQPYIDGPVSGFGGSHLAPAGNATKDYRVFAPASTTTWGGIAWTENGNYHALGAGNEGWPIAPTSSANATPNFISDGGSYTVTITPVSASGNCYLSNYFGTGHLDFVGSPTGTVQVGMLVTGAGVAAGTYITSNFSGNTWVVNINQTVGSAGSPVAMTMTAGSMAMSPTTGMLEAGYFVQGTGIAANTQISPWAGWTSTVIVQPSQTVGPVSGVQFGQRGLTFSPSVSFNDGEGPKTCYLYLSGTSGFGGMQGGGGDGVYSGFGTNGVFNAIPVNGSGSCTANIAGYVGPGLRLAIGGKYAEWLYFKGSGSITTDVPLRSGIVDQTAWVKSRMIPPFAIPPSSLAPSTGAIFSGAQVIPFYGAYGYYYGPGSTNPGPGRYAYWPYSMGSNGADSAGGWYVNGGFGHYLCGTPLWTSSEFYVGDQVSYFQALVAALGWGNWVSDFVMSSNPTVPPNTGNNTDPAGGARSYTGMGPTTPFASLLVAGPPYNGQPMSWPGYTAPTASINGIVPNNDRAHQAEFVSWAFLRTGRPELLDRLIGEAFFTLGSALYAEFGGPGHNLSTVIPGKTYYNLFLTNAGHQIRAGMNLLRYLSWATLLYPSDPSGSNNSGNTFDGSRFDKYLFDTLDDQFHWLNDFVDPQYATQLYPVPTNPGATFHGYIDNGSGSAGNILHVTSVTAGALAVNQPVSDASGLIAANTFISALGTGTGGTGTYILSSFTGGTYNSTSQLVGSSGSPRTDLFSGAPALISNDKDLVTMPATGSYWNRGNTAGICYAHFPFAACTAVAAGSTAAAKWLQNVATYSQAYADRRGGRINSWNIGNALPSDAISQTVLPEDENTWTTTWYKITSYGSVSIDCANVSPSPSSRGFTITYTFWTGGASSITLGNGDFLTFNIPSAGGLTLPPGLTAGATYAIADWTPGSGNATFNLRDMAGNYITPGAALTGIGNYFTTGYRSNGYGARNLTAWLGEFVDEYTVAFNGGISWAKALADGAQPLVGGGAMSDPNGYIANAVADGVARLAANGAANWVGGTVWLDNYGPGNGLMATFTP